MRRELRGKRCLLTGASGGIGRALANALAEAGCRLMLTGRRSAALIEVVQPLQARGVDAHYYPADLTDPLQRRQLLEQTIAQLGGLDLLINNAGIGSWGHFDTSTPEILRQVMEVNFFAPVELTRLALPYLQRGDQPAVVNVTSMCGRRGMPAWSEYSASKCALVGMSEAWRGEFARFDVDVITIVPGLTNSGLDQHLLRKEGRAEIRFDQGMTPEYLARRIVAAICANRREVVIGREARQLLWFHRFFPRLTDWLIGRRIRALYRSNRSTPALFSSGGS
ncbi:MAG: SDR family oxidoreductase [Gemmataceae bacterium]|nr:SDR family oxidoreductase [Gemmataceae bacterium]MCS7271525.1 SDR family oxidoreductase [Gemmataceae bacterium]MDW8242960.1 SDR family oxidoreductase [Thermogemmata sp.]